MGLQDKLLSGHARLPVVPTRSSDRGRQVITRTFKSVARWVRHTAPDLVSQSFTVARHQRRCVKTS